MLKSKTLMVKTRSGKILKIVREHYLRDDIDNGLLTDKLDLHPLLQNDLVPHEHFLVLDTNVILHQMDVIEHPCIKNVIILQTVLREVRHRSSPVYKRLSSILENPDKKFFVFTNEHCIETWTARKRKESSNDLNDRLIRIATKYYSDCLSDRNQQAVLLTNDEANCAFAVEEGLIAYTAEKYVKSVVGHPELLDKLAKVNEAIEVDRSISYPEHLKLSQLNSGIKTGRFKQGKLNISRENYLEGKILCPDVKGGEILIQGRLNLNRAVHEDIVAVELASEEEWSAPSDVMLDVSIQPGAEISDSVDKKVVSNAHRVPSGKIVGIIKRSWRPYCGILENYGTPGMTRHLFTPAERRIPRIRIETRQFKSLIGQRIVVAIDCWPKHSKYPQGHFVRSLGEIGDKETENEVLLLEHDVSHAPFSQAVLNCLPSPNWAIPEEELRKREDLRGFPICSVDPPGCTDIDDCLHFIDLNDGSGAVEVGVHIADVSHFIRPSTPIDEEARCRGTTVYLCDKRIDMVPALLSSNLCSLRDDGDRLAFSCIWKMSLDAKILQTRFCKSVIRSKASLTYAQAQMMIDDPAKTDNVTVGLRGLNKLAKILKSRRILNGALSLASPEVRFHVDSETHDPIDLQTKELRDTNSMVEEFMLLANCSVAEHIQQEFPECAVLRKHPGPPPSNFDVLINAAKTKQLDLNTSTSRELAVSLDNAEKPQPGVNLYISTLLRILATRCMLQAVYFCSGLESDFKHYGLAAPIYTHFTSPIRRYSDIMVHRLLAASIGADVTFSELLDKQEIQKICNNLNFRHRMAQYAQRASVALHTQLFFRGKLVDEKGYIIFVRKNAVQVLIPKYGLEGTVFLDRDCEGNAMTMNNLNYVEQDCKIFVGSIALQVFDEVVVQISHDASNIQHQRINLKLVKPNLPGISSVPSES
ncbi:exosome complex exonuclease RRP44-like [Clavelina lepadiformis]|uniref:exosome complex exonuclease RRP44-like n=1 Tax=Clavelina lepadiformis TaxID=159417 RepID=UPI0040431DF3